MPSVKPFTNEEWVRELRSPVNDDAVETLRTILFGGVRSLFIRHRVAEPDELARDLVQTALIKILDKLDTFRGESRFTTWAMKIAVREAISELRHRRWKDVSLDKLIGSEDDDGIGFQFATDEESIDTEVGRKILLGEVVSIIEEVMTEKQRLVMKCIILEGIPLEVVAGLLHTNRNNLYKLMHDARMRLKKEFLNRGYSLDDILENL